MELLLPAVSKLGRRYTCRPSRADHPLHATATRLTAKAGSPPPATDHRPLLRPIRNQGRKGYCFAFATALVKEFNCVIWGAIQRGWNPDPDPLPADISAHLLGGYLSPDYLGWKTQVVEGTFGQDLGGSLADSFAAAQSWGICPEAFLPYDDANKAHAGNTQCDVAAHPYRFRQPCMVAVNPAAFSQVLADNHVIAVGFSVFPSFEDTGPDGVVKPVRHGEPLLGGHAVDEVGFEYLPISGKRYGIWRNHWDTSWGDKGYCYVPEDYYANVWDAWTTA